MSGYGLRVTVEVTRYDGKIEGEGEAKIVPPFFHRVEATPELLASAYRPIIAAEIGRQILTRWDELVASVAAEHLP